MGWTTHFPVFVDPDEREPYWTEYFRTLNEAQDDMAEELAAGVGAGRAHNPSLLRTPECATRVGLAAREDVQSRSGVHSRSQGRRWT